MSIMNKNILFAIMTLLLILSCSKQDDKELLQSLVFVPEHRTVRRTSARVPPVRSLCP